MKLSTNENTNNIMMFLKFTFWCVVCLTITNSNSNQVFGFVTNVNHHGIIHPLQQHQQQKHLPNLLHPTTSLLQTKPQQRPPRRHHDDNNSPTTILEAWPKDRDPKGVAPDYPQTKSRLVVTILATILTWQAHNAGLCSSVLASCATTLAASLWSPGLGQAAFIGSFTGMSSVGVLPGIKETLLAGSVTAALFEIIIHRQNRWLGLGGRLGFLAFIATNTVAFMGGVTPFPTGSVAFSLKTMKVWWETFCTGPLLLGAMYGALGSVATILLREAAEGGSDDMSDPIRAASVVGILSALLVGIHASYTPFAALLMFGGSFTGMSLPLRLCKGVIPGRKKRRQPWISSVLACFALSGALGGIIHAGSLGVDWWSTPAGWGGKAGASAFGGVLIFRAIEKIIHATRLKIWGEEKEELPEIY